MMGNNRFDPLRNWLIIREKLLKITASIGSGTLQTAVDGFQLHRQISNNDPKPHFLQPVIIVVAQGKKLVRIGGEEHHFGENLCFVGGVDLPVTSCVMEAGEDKPYLSMSLDLDPGLIASLSAKVPPLSGRNDGMYPGGIVQTVEPPLLDALLRLLDLVENPEQIPVLGELLLKEIHYRLLTGPFGGLLRSLNTYGSQNNQINQAVSWLKNNYKEPLRVEALAQRLNMAPSTFHKHFKGVTTLSPLQYQKRLRLGEAQRLMLSAGSDVAQAAFAVGYESVPQFIREYKRLFGEPPRRNVVRMQAKIHEVGQLAAV